MKNLRDSLKASGYDSEEAYFYAREQELIKKMRESNAQQPKLELIAGGKTDSQAPVKQATKKAA